jgi:cyclopropane-fatty-acyl-phospholipid synthase
MRLAEVLDKVTGGATGIEFRAYDGSRAGPRHAAVALEVRSQRTLRYLVQARNDLGLARAYVSGGLEVHGDLRVALRGLWETGDGNVPWRERLEILRAVGLRALRPVAPPPEEVRPRGRRHSRRRDAVAVSHHYDVSNRFYRWILGPSMAYTCAVYPDESAGLEEAQFAKFDLVCRKLGLQAGMRLLDVGCGWGGMVLHAARHYGVKTLGVTLSREQVEWGRREIYHAGLGDRAEVRHLDYRNVPESEFDAISSIGLTEHIGRAEMPAYFALLHSKLRPRGRLLNHSITRPDNVYPSLLRDGFIDRYVFPDAELSGPGLIISNMTDAGFELRHEENFREHYVRTLDAWLENLEAHRADAVAEVGEGRTRVWRLYLAGSQVAFELRDALELHQVLGVKTERGESAMPLGPHPPRAALEPSPPRDPVVSGHRCAPGTPM